MNVALAGHRRYLEVFRDACKSNPMAHTHQLAALDREISLVTAASDPAAYRSASNELFELTRAMWLDRVANHARVNAAVGERTGAQADALEYSVALAAESEMDWMRRLAETSDEITALRSKALETGARFSGLLMCLAGWGGDKRPLLKDFYTNEVAETYRELMANDPGFTWSKTTRHPPYRLRLPWTGEAASLFASWSRELGFSLGPEPSVEPGAESGAADPLGEISAGEARWRAGLLASAGGVAGLNEPSVDNVLSSYRTVADSTNSGDRVSSSLRRVACEILAAASSAPTPQDAMTRLVETGLLARFAAAPLKARAEEAIERQTNWPDPLVDHHWRAVAGLLDRTRTPTEVDLAAAYTDACFAIEASWNVSLHTSLLAPLRAAFVFALDRSEDARRGLVHAATASYGLLGLGPRELLNLPHVSAIIDRNVVPWAFRDMEGLGAFQGEVGFDLLLEARNWIVMQAAKGSPYGLDSSSTRQLIVASLDAAGVPEFPAAPRPVELWEQHIPLRALTPALTRPPRPTVAGITELHQR
jgi:hypothetical protein